MDGGWGEGVMMGYIESILEIIEDLLTFHLALWSLLNFIAEKSLGGGGAKIR